MMVGRLLSFWYGLFPGTNLTLNFQGVYFTKNPAYLGKYTVHLDPLGKPRMHLRGQKKIPSEMDFVFFLVDPKDSGIQMLPARDAPATWKIHW